MTAGFCVLPNMVPGLDLPDKRIGRGDTQMSWGNIVSKKKGQQEEKYGAKLLVHRLIFSLVIVVPGPVVEKLTQRVKNPMWLLKEKQNIQRLRFAGKLTT